jgi:hypothetical protein
MSENGSCARYFVEELIGGVQEEEWIDSSTMEILRGGSNLETCAERPVVNASRRTGAKEGRCEQVGAQSVIVKGTTCGS